MPVTAAPPLVREKVVDVMVDASIGSLKTATIELFAGTVCPSAGTLRITVGGTESMVPFKATRMGGIPVGVTVVMRADAVLAAGVGAAPLKTTPKVQVPEAGTATPEHVSAASVKSAAFAPSMVTWVVSGAVALMLVTVTVWAADATAVF
jgi:hypothetical protein